MLGSQLRTVRITNNVEVEEFAKRSKLTKAKLIAIESGKEKLTNKVLIGLTEICYKLAFEKKEAARIAEEEALNKTLEEAVETDQTKEEEGYKEGE